MDRTTSAKAALRSRVLAERAALSTITRQEAAAAIRDHLGRAPAVREARVVIGYAAFGAEVDLDPLLADLIADGVGVLLPRVDGDELVCSRVRDLEADLVPGYRGVREPRAGGRSRARPDRADVLFVPGVAFDRWGHRLGYGGGHFDRLLARTAPEATCIGVAFEAQLVDRVPVEDHDADVDLIVTERGILEPLG